MKTPTTSALCGAFVVILAISACSLLRSSPTATFKAFFQASEQKDIWGMKKSLSKSTVAMFDKLAKEQNKSTDDMLKGDEGAKISWFEGLDKKIPETRNEKITGDTATLEVKNDRTGKWDTLPFVKEDGEWKIALDKFLEDMMKGLGEKLPDK